MMCFKQGTLTALSFLLISNTGSALSANLRCGAIKLAAAERSSTLVGNYLSSNNRAKKSPATSQSSGATNLASSKSPAPSKGQAASKSSAAAQPLALTRQASDKFKEGNLEEAISLQEKAIRVQPKYWLSHAAMSFYCWQQGNILKAVEEGQKAVNLSARNYVALTNLALIKEGLEDCQGAIPLYEQAAKIEPGEWVPMLGLARCQNKAGHPDAGLAVMKEMASKTGKNFNWYFELADTYVRLEKPDLAVEPAAKAIELAKSIQEKESAANLQLLVLLQTNQLEKAAALKEQVFKEFAPKNQQVYVRTAVSLLPATNSEKGKELLDTALKNLDSSEDAEGFYRLGIAFQEKSKEAGLDATVASAWLDNAATAFKRANELTERAKYYMALAAVFDEQGKPSEVEAALNKSVSLFKWDTLAPFLLSALGSKPSPGCSQLNLDKVKIKIDNLNCSCHISKVVEALNQIDGVAYVYVPANTKPYEGLMIIDQSKNSVADAFAKAVEKTKVIYAAMVPPIVPAFSALSTTKLKSAAEAIEVTQAAEYGNITSFYSAFKAVVPFEPVKELAAHSKSTM